MSFFRTLPLCLVVFFSPGCGEKETVDEEVLLIKTPNEELGPEAFWFYCSLNYPEIPQGADAERDDELLSRVYDNFRRDLLLVEIYYNLGFRVLDDQVDSFIASKLGGKNIHQMPLEQQVLWRNEIRRRIAIQQFLQKKILEDTVVTDEMINEYYLTHEKEFFQEALYHIRFLQMGTREQADTFRKEMRKSKKLFKEVAADYAVNESYALAVPMPLDNLLTPFSNAIVKLKPGQHTKVIAIKSQPGEPAAPVAGENAEIDETTNYYVLYLESITEETQTPVEEAYEQVRIKLEKTKRQELLEKTLQRFEGRLLEEYRERLPFQYLPPDQNEEV